MKRSICIVTGTRAEYGLLKPIMVAVEKNPKLRLQLIVTGMHLVPEFGYTIKEIQNDGFTIDAKVDMVVASDTLSAMAKSVGLGIIGITQALEQLEPHIIILLGDRIEPLAAAIAASIMNIPIAHIGGGQSSGGIDNSIRHAITRLANIHFATSPVRSEVLREVGEEDWRIHTIGNLCLDTILNFEMIPPAEIAAKYALDLKEPVLLVLFHSDTLDIDSSISQMKNLSEALVELNIQTILIYPNADAGSRQILGIIKDLSSHPKTRVYTNLPQIEYYSIMNVASLMIGNSSSGLTEAPVFKLPVIGLGERQAGRERFGNVVDIPGEKQQIIHLVRKILSDSDYRARLGNCSEIFGDGKAGEKVAKILAKLQINDMLIRKRLQLSENTEDKP